jgi:hypothetical protein
VNLAPMGVLRGKKRHNDDGPHSASDANDLDRRRHNSALRPTNFTGRPKGALSGGACELTSATRMRRLRDRKKAGSTFVRALIPPPVASHLVAMGWLRPNATAAQVRRAFLQMVRQALAHGVRPT